MKKPLFLLLLQFAVVTTYAQVADSLKKDTVLSTPSQVTFSRRQSITSYIVPAALISYGLLSFPVKAFDNLDHHISINISRGHHHVLNHWDDFLQYSPAIAVYALNISGVKGKHNFADRTGAYLLAEGIMSSTTWVLKHETDRSRPNGFKYSFPSGHTGTAFVAAEFISQEYGDISCLYSIGGYTIATGVAALRVYNNYHAFSDVVAGAGIGIVSAKMAYLIYPFIKRKLFPAKSFKIVMMPAYQTNYYGLYIAGRL